MMYKKFENSSQLFSASYFEHDNSLIIKFVKGYSYTYYDVPQETFLALCNAESAGSYFMKNISKKFKYEKI